MLSASVLSGPAPAPLCTAGPRGRRKPGAGRLRATVRGRLEPCSSVRASVWTFPGEDQLPGGPGQREKLRTFSREFSAPAPPTPLPLEIPMPALSGLIRMWTFVTFSPV